MPTPTRNTAHVNEALALLTSAYQRPRPGELVSGSIATNIFNWLTSGAGTAFNPTDLSGIDLWLRPDLGVTTVSASIPDIQTWGPDTGMASITGGQSDPVGGSNAAKLTENGTTGIHTTYSYPVGTNDLKGTRTITLWAKANGRSWLNVQQSLNNFWVNVTTGTLGTVTTTYGDPPTIVITSVGGGWWKIEFTAQRIPALAYFNSYVRLSFGTADNTTSYTGDGTSGMYIYGLTIGSTSLSGWANQSGSADANRNASQATAALQPSVTTSNANFGGQPTVRFEVGFHTMSLHSGSWAVPPSNPNTVFLVGKNLGGSQVFFDSLNSSRWLIDVVGGSPGSFTLEAWLSAGLAKSSLPSDSPSIIGADFVGGGTSALYFNALTAAVTGNAGSWFNPPGYSLGATYVDTAALDGDIAEVVIYNRVLNSSERALLLAYFGTRYGISVGA